MKEDFVKMIKGADHQAMQKQPKVGRFTIGICSYCNNEVLANEFYSKQNLVEFIISGFCQKCQNKILEKGK